MHDRPSGLSGGGNQLLDIVDGSVMPDKASGPLRYSFWASMINRLAWLRLAAA